MEELLTVDILLVVTKGIFSVFLVLVKLVGTNFETVALETLVLLLKLLFVVVLFIVKVDLVVKTGIDVVDGNIRDRSAGSKTLRRQI